MFFKKKVIKSFKRVKTDLADTKAQHFELKRSTNEWIQYLYRENELLKARVKELEMASHVASKEYY